MKVLILVLVFLTGCAAPKSDSSQPTAPTKPVPGIGVPTPTPTATPTPTPSATPTPTPSPTPTPTPTPSPTPDPLIGVWQNQTDPTDIFVFAATSGSQSFCNWTWSGWAWTNIGEVTLQPLNQTTPNAGVCNPSPGVFSGTRACGVHFNTNNEIQMSCLYNGQHIYIRQ